MTLRRRVLPTLCVGLLLAGAAAAATGSAASAAAPTPSRNFATTPDINFDAARVGQTVMTRLAHAPGYAGVRIISTGLEVDVAGSVPDAAAAAAAARSINPVVAGDRVPVIFRHVRNAMSSLLQVRDRIAADAALLNSRRIDVTMQGPDVTSNRVVVRVARYSPATARLITARYGPGLVSVYPHDFALSASSDRYNDTAPWWGGDFINVAGSGCTSWFSLTSTVNHVDYNATAGHCGVGNVYNHNPSDGVVDKNYQGTVDSSRVHWVSGGSTDVSVYPVTSNQPRVWADPTAQSRAVTSRAGGDPQGTLLCTDGTVDREVCSVRIVAALQDGNYNGKTIANQVYCEQVSHHNAFSSGDSGGPVYAGKNGSAEAQAFGMIVAHYVSSSGQPINWAGLYTPVRFIFAVYPPGLTFKPAN